MTVEARRYVGSYLSLAKQALDGSNALLSVRNRNAVYLAQQGAEHLVLAIAQTERIQFPRHHQHQLDLMVSKLPRENPFRTHLDDVTWLESYATAYRYPRTSGGLCPEPDRLKLLNAIIRLYETLDLLARYFEVDLDERQPMARHCHPPRASEPDDPDHKRVRYVEMTPR